jgi:ABC-2 type transport system permease protein
MEDPNGTLATALSLFPLTAPATLPLRLFVTPVPLWQISLSVGLLVVTALCGIWLAGRAFRLGMLRYGQRLRLRELTARPPR